MRGRSRPRMRDARHQQDDDVAEIVGQVGAGLPGMRRVTARRACAAAARRALPRRAAPSAPASGTPAPA
nr:hypothetical protein [Burkholderia stagnalis]